MRADRTPKVNEFSPLKKKKVEFNFAGGHVSSDAGVLLLREVDNSLSLSKRAAKFIPDPRAQFKVTHSSESMLRQRVYGLACGWEDLNDHDSLRHDIAFQSAIETEIEPASSATLSRFENRGDRQSAVEMNKLFVDVFIESHKVAPEEIILDFDATDSPLHGKQEGRFYHGYYKSYCFLPLHVYCGEHLLISYLRPSDEDGALHAGAILKLLIKRIRQTWPDTKVKFRADGGFCRKQILHWCENNNVEYIVGIGGNKRLRKLSADLEGKAKSLFEESGEKQKLFSSIKYKAKSWRGEERDITVKVEYSISGINIRYVVSNINAPPEKLYNDIYCARGNMENKIKEQKLLFSTRMSCHEWYANQFRLLLSGLAYILLDHLRRKGLKDTQFENAQVNTIKLILLKIGAVITRNTRRIKIMISNAYPNKEEFTKLAFALSSA